MNNQALTNKEVAMLLLKQTQEFFKNLRLEANGVSKTLLAYILIQVKALLDKAKEQATRKNIAMLTASVGTLGLVKVLSNLRLAKITEQAALNAKTVKEIADKVAADKIAEEAKVKLEAARIEAQQVAFASNNVVAFSAQNPSSLQRVKGPNSLAQATGTTLAASKSQKYVNNSAHSKTQPGKFKKQTLGGG